MPCQVQGIRSVLDRNNINNFIISFCCSGQTTLEGTWLCYRYMGIDKSQVINMQYRGNGWPSGIQIELFDGKKIYKNNYTNPWRLMHQSKLFRPKRCLMCKEDISYKADVSLADPWLGKYKISDKIGHTMFLINTEKGLAFIEDTSLSGARQYTQSPNPLQQLPPYWKPDWSSHLKVLFPAISLLQNPSHQFLMCLFPFQMDTRQRSRRRGDLFFPP